MNTIINRLSNPFLIIFLQISALLFMMMNDSLFEMFCFIVAFITIPYGAYIYNTSPEAAQKIFILGLLLLNNALLHSSHPITFKILSVALIVAHGIYIGRSMNANRQYSNNLQTS